jgi:hypothetical protein
LTSTDCIERLTQQQDAKRLKLIEQENKRREREEQKRGRELEAQEKRILKMELKNKRLEEAERKKQIQARKKENKAKVKSRRISCFKCKSNLTDAESLSCSLTCISCCNCCCFACLPDEIRMSGIAISSETYTCEMCISGGLEVAVGVDVNNNNVF